MSHLDPTSRANTTGQVMPNINDSQALHGWPSPFDCRNNSIANDSYHHQTHPSPSLAGDAWSINPPSSSISAAPRYPYRSKPFSNVLEYHQDTRSSSQTFARPMRSSRMSEHVDTVTFTPTTHRVSRAKKGKRVHACDKCEKIFTRAEHLRRHQLNHSTEAMIRCEVSDCPKTFKRQDLLARHMERHNEIQSNPSLQLLDDSISRRTSGAHSISTVDRNDLESATTARHGAQPASQRQALLYQSSLMEESTPIYGQTMPSNPVTTADFYSPVFSASSAPVTGSYLADVAYSNAEDPGIVSSASSLYSAFSELPHANYAPPQIYGVQRARSDSAMSAPEPSYVAARPLLPSGSVSSTWLSGDASSPQPSRSTTVSYEEGTIPSVATPAPSSNLAWRTLSELRLMMRG